MLARGPLHAHFNRMWIFTVATAAVCVLIACQGLVGSAQSRVSWSFPTTTARPCATALSSGIRFAIAS